MYAQGTRVVITAKDSGYEGLVGYISEGHWGYLNGKRRANYLVAAYGGYGNKRHDILLGSKDITRADGQCDCCNQWRRNSQLFRQTYKGEEMLAVCWYCENVTYKDEG